MTDKATESAKDGAAVAFAAASAAPPARPEASAPAGEEEAASAAAAAAPAVGGKRARTALSLHEKAVVKSFCEQKVGESKARGELVPSQDQLRREIASKFGWACGRSTLSKIVSMDWKQLQQGALQNPNMKRQRRPLFPAFEADLVKFISAFIDAAGSGERPLAADSVDAMLPEQSNEHGEGAIDAGSTPTDRLQGNKAVLTEALILEEAQRLKQVHSIRDEQLVLSVGWLARFKHRHGIRLRKAPAGTRSGGDARAREVGESRVAMTPGTSSSIPTGVDSVNWNSVDPLLLSSSSNMLDALHVVDNEAMAVGKGQSDAHSAAMSATASLERQMSDAKDAQQGVGDVQEDLMELIASIASPSALCGLLTPSEPSDKDESLWQPILDKMPNEIRSLARRCGCSELRTLSHEGMIDLRVVVVGANSTVDAFVAAALVGDRGRVACIEPVKASRELGARHADQYVRDVLQYPTTTDPILQFIGADSIAPELDSLRATADVVLINCSLQTGEASRVQRALAMVSALLKPGGELRFATMCCSRRLSSGETAEISPSLETAKEQLLRSPYYVDVCLLCQKLGQRMDLRTITSPLDQAFTASLLGDAQTKFYRCTFRLFAVEDTELSAEDYGQVAIFAGRPSDASNALQPSESAYRLDDEFCFAKGERVAVDGNTARVLQTSWLRGFFTVEGEGNRHRGGFQRMGWLAALRPRSDTPKEDADAPIVSESRMVVADI